MIHKRQAAVILRGGKPALIYRLELAVLYTNDLRFITVQILYLEYVTG